MSSLGNKFMRHTTGSPLGTPSPSLARQKKMPSEGSSVDTPGAYAEAVHGKKEVEQGSSPLRT